MRYAVKRLGRTTGRSAAGDENGLKARKVGVQVSHDPHSTELRQLSGGALVQVLSPAHKTNHLQTRKKMKDIRVLG